MRQEVFCNSKYSATQYELKWNKSDKNVKWLNYFPYIYIFKNDLIF